MESESDRRSAAGKGARSNTVIENGDREVDDRTEDTAERRLRSLMAITAALARGSAAAEVLQSVVDSARYLLDAESARLELIEPIHADGTLGRKLVAVSGAARHAVDSVRPLDQGAGAYVIETGRPILALELSAGVTIPAGAARSATPYLHNESGVSVPLHSAGRIVGTLAVLHSRPYRFDEGDVEVMEQFALLASMAVDAGRRLQREQDDQVRRRDDEIRLHRQARTDALTGLANRRSIIESVAAALDRGDRERPAGLLFVDLDRFKRVNDGLGHRVGDSLLVEVARRFAAAIGEGEVLGRLGGDEFVVLLESVAMPEVALAVARRLASSLLQPICVDGRHLTVTASTGVALADADSDVETLLRDADTAMYQAKAAGRDTQVLLDRRAASSTLAELNLEEELRLAVADDQLRLAFQPVYDLRDGTLQGFEALVRWAHPRRSLLLPTDFLAMAEETGLIRPIGSWVLHRAVEILAGYLSAVPHLAVGVNISPRQLAGDELVDQIDDALAATGLPPDHLILEITENLAMRPGLDRTLQRIHDRGVRMAIDDLGTGYSNLAYLKSLPVTILKVDQSFVAGLADDERDRAIVTSLLGLGTSLDMSVVAEGIETPAQLAVLHRLGCGYGQGNLFGAAAEPPAPDVVAQMSIPVDEGCADRA